MGEPFDAEPLIDSFVDRALRGEAPDLEEFLEQNPQLPAPAVRRLRKLASALLGGKRRESPEIVDVEDESLPFEKLGEFRLERLLGSGGMGDVYLATQESLGREVALKIMQARLRQTDKARQRFRREAQTVGRLRHPNIAALYESGVAEQVEYLALEYVPGPGIDELLVATEGHRLTVPEAVRWCRDVGRALICAHEGGIVHRDVKPSNIRLAADGRAMLLDFGLARDQDLEALSRTQNFRGTPYYASPEQVERGPEEVGPASDVYSLGVTLYECVTGCLPFQGKTSARVFQQILAHEPPPARRLNPAVGRDLEAVIATAMEKAPARRYATAEAFTDDLEALLEGRPVRARPLSALRRLVRWAERRPAAAAAAVLAILLFVGGPLTFAIQERRVRREVQYERNAARRAQTRETAARQRAEGLFERSLQQSFTTLDEFVKKTIGQPGMNPPPSRPGCHRGRAPRVPRWALRKRPAHSPAPHLRLSAAR